MRTLHSTYYSAEMFIFPTTEKDCKETMRTPEIAPIIQSTLQKESVDSIMFSPLLITDKGVGYYVNPPCVGNPCITMTVTWNNKILKVHWCRD